MPDLEEKPIIDSIKKEYMPWQKVRIVRQYDPELIKGYIVDFGDKILDKSCAAAQLPCRAAPRCCALCLVLTLCAPTLPRPTCPGSYGSKLKKIKSALEGIGA